MSRRRIVVVVTVGLTSCGPGRASPSPVVVPTVDIAAEEAAPPRVEDPLPLTTEPPPDEVDVEIARLADADPAVRAEAVFRLRTMKLAAVSPLLGMLSDEAWGQTHFTDGWHPIGLLASQSLIDVGESAVAGALAMMGDEDALVRAMAARTLVGIADEEMIEPDPGFAVAKAALLEATHDDDPRVRAEAIGLQSEDAEWADRAFVLTRDPSAIVRAAARRWLAVAVHYGDRPAPELQRYIDLLSPGGTRCDDSAEDPCGGSRTRAARCRLNHANPAVRGNALLARPTVLTPVEIASRFGDPCPHTTRGADSVDTRSVGARAVSAVWWVGPKAIPAVVKATRAGSPAQREDAAAALGSLLEDFGPDDVRSDTWQRAVEALLAAADDEDPGIAASALVWAVKDERLVQRQLAAMADPVEDVRIAAQAGLESQLIEGHWPPELTARIEAHVELGPAGAPPS